jgi:hypothetical protein
MPTDRHTATGTCEFGRAAHKLIDSSLQEKSTRAAKKVCAASALGPRSRHSKLADDGEGRLCDSGALKLKI